MDSTLARQLQHPRYLGLFFFSFLCVGFLLLSIVIWSDLRAVWRLPFLSLSETVQAMLSLYTHPLMHMTVATLVGMVVASFSGAINIVLLTYLRRERRAYSAKLVEGKSVMATILITLGMGCASCGSVVLLSLFSLFGLGLSAWTVYWLASLLLGLAIVLLSYSNIQLYRQISHPGVCD